MFKNNVYSLTQMIHSDITEFYFDKNNFINYYNKLTLLEKFELSLSFMCNRWFTEDIAEQIEIQNNLEFWMTILENSNG